MEVREFRLSDLGGIKKIVQELHPKWFDDGAVVNIPIDVRFQKTYVADNEGAVVGFICLRSQDGKPYIGWAGVSPGSHGQGIGKNLVGRAEDEVIKAGADTLRVKTVVEQNPNDESYNNTVKFYEACGFKIESKSDIKKTGGFVYRMGVMLKELRK